MQNIFFIWFSNGVIKKWPFINNLSIKSAKLQNPNCKINLYLSHPIEDPDFLSTYQKYVDKFVLIDNEKYEYYKGCKLEYFAHKCDILRLELIIKYGGLYLDLDTISLKSIEDVILKKDRCCIFPDYYGISNYILYAPVENTLGYQKILKTYCSFRSRGVDHFYLENISYFYRVIYENNKNDFCYFEYDENNMNFMGFNEACDIYNKNLKFKDNVYIAHIFKNDLYIKASNPTKEYILNNKNTINNILKNLI